MYNDSGESETNTTPKNSKSNLFIQYLRQKNGEFYECQLNFCEKYRSISITSQGINAPGSP